MSAPPKKLPARGMKLAEYAPQLIAEWHPTKNGALTPQTVTKGTNTKIWWRCRTGHEWATSVAARTIQKQGCPYCWGRYTTPETSLANLRPDLAREWHPIKNAPRTPDEVTAQANCTLWWQCKDGHEWRASPNARVNSNNSCPVCKSLAVKNPELARQWHPIKNGSLTAYDCYAKTSKKAWWKCESGHEWQSAISSRKQNQAGIYPCPICTNRRRGQSPHYGTTLADFNPVVADEWHPTKNGKLKPTDVAPKSGQKAWWRCAKGHQWEAVISSRTTGMGCPYCSNRLVDSGNCLSTTHPAVAAEWHPDKNHPLTPDAVTFGTGRKVWWLCERGHEWCAAIPSRTSLGTNCPYCCNQKVGYGNSLGDVNPALAAEWAQDLNGDLTPFDVTPSTGKVVWWRCIRGHEWRSSLANRSAGKGCAKCAGRTSRLEVRLYCELEAIFPQVAWASRVAGMQVDLLLPEQEIGLEIDGCYWHRGKAKRDREKTTRLEAAGIKIIRLREKPLRRFRPTDVAFPTSNISKATINEVLDSISTLTPEQKLPRRRIEWYLRQEDFVAKDRYREVAASLPSPPTERSLAAMNPELASEWHPTKNAPLTPTDLHIRSGRKAWWLCAAGHEWRAAVSSRVAGRGCPICARKNQWMIKAKPVRFLETGEVFPSAIHAEKALGIHRTTIGEHCRGSVKRRRFEFAE